MDKLEQRNKCSPEPQLWSRQHQDLGDDGTQPLPGGSCEDGLISKLSQSLACDISCKCELLMNWRGSFPQHLNPGPNLQNQKSSWRFKLICVSATFNIKRQCREHCQGTRALMSIYYFCQSHSVHHFNPRKSPGTCAAPAALTHSSNCCLQPRQFRHCLPNKYTKLQLLKISSAAFTWKTPSRSISSAFSTVLSSRQHRLKGIQSPRKSLL